MNREVTIRDMIIYFLIALIIIAGYSNNMVLITSKIPPSVKYHYIFWPLSFASSLLTPKTSIIIASIILIFYTSVRFLDAIEVRYFIIFGGMLFLGYRYNGRLIKNLSLFHAMLIVAVPQLINTLIYTILKDRGNR